MEWIVIDLLFVFAVGVLYTRISANYVKTTVQFPETAFSQQTLTGKVCVLFEKKIFFGKTKIFLQFENKMTGEILNTECKAFAGCGKTSDTDIHFTMRYSGKVVCTVRKVKVYDWFGITYRTVYPKTKAKLLIMPEYTDDAVEEMVHLQNSMEGMHLIPHKQGYDYSEPAGIREYQHGDSMKSIHWKLTGRMDRLFVKEASIPAKEAFVILAETIHETALNAQECHRLASRLLCVCTWLLERNISYKTVWYCKEKEQLMEITVESAQDIQRLLHQFMGCRQMQGSRSGKSFYEQFRGKQEVYYIA